MAEEKLIRLGQASRKLNVGHNTILEFLAKKGFTVENNPNAKLTPEQFAMLSKEYASSASEKLEASGLSIGVKHTENLSVGAESEAHRKKAEDEERIMIKNLGSTKQVPAKEEPVEKEKVEVEKPKLGGIKVLGKIDLEKEKKKPEPEPEPVVVEVKEKEVKEKKEEPVVAVVVEKAPEQELIKARADNLQGLKVIGKIDLPVDKKKDQPVASSDIRNEAKKRPRKRIISPNDNRGSGPGTGTSGPGVKRNMPPRTAKAEPSEKEIQDQKMVMHLLIIL